MLKIHPEKHHAAAESFCRTFMAPQGRPRYILGRNEYAVSIAEAVDVDGFIDDFTSDTMFMGKPVLKMTDVPKESLVVSCVIFVVPLTALANLQKQGLACLDYFNFHKYSGLKIKAIEFLEQAKADILGNMDKYRWLHDRFEDARSKEIFEKFVNFRLSSDPEYLEGFVNDPDGQYFEDFLAFGPGEVFVDAGGFDGQTSIYFIQRCPEYGSVHLFEPDPHNIDVARERLAAYPNVHYHNFGLGSERGTLRFSSGGGSASAVTDTGDMEIEVDTIDHLVREPITTIKMDIEGSERPALQGARSHIVADHPKLAISCYHKYDDLWTITEDILAMRDDYALYLRHYTEGLHESVLFFIPRR